MNEELHKQISNLCNRILHCPWSMPSKQGRHCCSIQQFQKFHIYPEMIQVGELYGENFPNCQKKIPKVLIIGQEPIQQLPNLEQKEVDALSRFATHLDQQKITNIPTKLVPMESIPSLDFDLYKELVHMNRTSHKTTHGWQISGFNQFYQDHKLKIWSDLFHIELDVLGVMAWDIEVNTNLTMCGAPFRWKESIGDWISTKPPHWMRKKCLQQGYLQEILEITLPDVVLCQGPTVWKFLETTKLYWNDGVHQLHKDESFDAEHPYLSKYYVDSHPILFQLMPHLSHYAPNSKWITYLRECNLYEIDEDLGDERSLLQYLGGILEKKMLRKS